MSAKKRTAQGTGLVAGGTYTNKIGKILKGVPTKSGKYLNPNRPLYFKPGAGKLRGSHALNNKVWHAESAADSALKNRIKINADISPGYDWTKTAKVQKMRTAGKILTKIGKTANVIGLAAIAGEGIYKGTKRALGPGGTQFHTGTGVPIWEDRNRANQDTKLNY